MLTLFNLSFSNTPATIVNTVIIMLLILGTYGGFKRGFLENGVRFIGVIIALVGSYFLKNPISVYLYTHLPFFKLFGIFKGVTVLNIIIYELIAFIIVFSILMFILKIIVKITDLVNKVLSFIFLFGIPNKILGLIFGFLETLVVLYFLAFAFRLGCSFTKFEVKDSLLDDLINLPILSQNLTPALQSLEEITDLAKEYKSINDKDEYNYHSLDILLKYEVITADNVKILRDKEKIKIENIDELIEKYEG